MADFAQLGVQVSLQPSQGSVTHLKIPKRGHKTEQTRLKVVPLACQPGTKYLTDHLAGVLYSFLTKTHISNPPLNDKHLSLSFFKATPTAYGSSQARGLIGLQLPTYATATAMPDPSPRSEPSLQSILQLRATPDP